MKISENQKFYQAGLMLGSLTAACNALTIARDIADVGKHPLTADIDEVLKTAQGLAEVLNLGYMAAGINADKRKAN